MSPRRSSKVYSRIFGEPKDTNPATRQEYEIKYNILGTGETIAHTFLIDELKQFIKGFLFKGISNPIIDRKRIKISSLSQLTYHLHHPHGSPPERHEFKGEYIYAYLERLLIKKIKNVGGRAMGNPYTSSYRIDLAIKP